MKGEGMQQDYGMRVYDPRLGKFLGIDPLTKEYPWYTPYQFAGNKPIMAIDLDGAEELPTIKKFDPETDPFPVIAAIDNGGINVLNSAIGLWNGAVQTVRSLNRGTYVKDLKTELKGTWSGIQETVNYVAKKPFSPLTVELITTVYLTGKIPLPGTNVPKGNLLKQIKVNPQNGEGVITPRSTFLGGAKGDLFSKRNILEANHTPTMKSLDIAGFKISYNEGSAFQMLYEEHRAFISTGSSKAAQAFRTQEASLLKQGKFMEAFDLNMESIKASFGSKYNEAMMQARDYYQNNIVPQLQKQLPQQQ